MSLSQKAEVLHGQGLSLADVDDIGRQRASALMRARPSLRLCACKSVFGPPEDRCRDRVNQFDQILGRLAREKDGHNLIAAGSKRR